jgi:hypothetical protein
LIAEVLLGRFMRDLLWVHHLFGVRLQLSKPPRYLVCGDENVVAQLATELQGKAVLKALHRIHLVSLPQPHVVQQLGACSVLVHLLGKLNNGNLILLTLAPFLLQ